MGTPSEPLVQFAVVDGVPTICLNDPDRRNALGTAMFDALDRAVAQLDDGSKGGDAAVVLLRGTGAGFCAGFDLEEAVDDPQRMAAFIWRLSRLNRSIRRLPHVLVAAVQGAALAGGCALLSACDFVVVEPDALLGYPVHRIGVSPAVTLPLLQRAVGDGPARALVLSGDLVDGRTAHRLGLASHLAPGRDRLDAVAGHLCRDLLNKGPHAMRVTKAWLNQLDGSLDDARFDATAEASAALAEGDEAVRMLRTFWGSRPHGR